MAFLTYLSKAFDCLKHELLIAKLNVYGFTLPALKLVHDYLPDRKQRARVNNFYIVHGLKYFLEYLKVLYLVKCYLTWFLADLFLTLNKIDTANYADDNTPYTSSNDVNGLINSLKESSNELFKWFDHNLMKGNPEKCNLLVSANVNAAIRMENFQIENTKIEKLLDIQIDNKPYFDYHISEICKKVNRKLYALVRVTSYMTYQKERF